MKRFLVGVFLIGWVTEACIAVGQWYDTHIGWYWG